MFGREKKQTGPVDGGADRQDERPDDDLEELTDRDFGWEEGDPADRRRDPLRKA